MGNSSAKHINPLPDGAQRVLVVVGGGFAGTKLLSTLVAKRATHAFSEIILIEPKDKFYHALAGARGTVLGRPFIDNAFFSYDKLLSSCGPHARQIRGVATSITENEVTVTTAEGITETVKFNFLSICTGSKIAVGKPDIDDSEAAARAVDDVSQALKSAKKVLIVGSGAVALELVGEMQHAYTGDHAKDITVVSAAPRLQLGVGITDKFHQKVMPKLTANFIFGDRVALPEEASQPVTMSADESKTTMEAAPSTSWHGACRVYAGNRTVTTQNGSVIESDITFYCVGSSRNSSCIQGALRDHLLESGKLRVNRFLQVEGFPKIFVGGDIVDAGDPNDLAAYAAFHGAKIAKNIVRSVVGKELSPYSSMGPVMFLALGPQKGNCQMPKGIIVGDSVCSKLKSKDLLLSSAKSIMNPSHSGLPSNAAGTVVAHNDATSAVVSQQPAQPTQTTQSKPETTVQTAVPANVVAEEQAEREATPVM